MYVPIGGPAWLQGWSNDTVTVGIIGCIANVTLTSVDSRPIHLTVESAALRHHVTQCRPQVPPWPPKSSTTVSSILSTMRWTTTKNTPCALSFWKPLRSTFTMKNWFCNIIWGGGSTKSKHLYEWATVHAWSCENWPINLVCRVWNTEVTGVFKVRFIWYFGIRRYDETNS